MENTKNFIAMTTFGTKIVKHEMFDTDAMHLLLNSDHLSQVDKKKLSAYNKSRKNLNIVEVKYDFPKTYKSNNIARVYAEKGLGLQAFPCDIRNILGKKYYFDIDIKNCHPTILLKICKDNNWNAPFLDEYVNKRDETLERMSNEYNLNKSNVKQIMNTLMYLGNIPRLNNGIDNDEFLQGYMNEMAILANNVRDKYSLIYKQVPKKRETEIQKISTTLSFVLSTEEHKILITMNNFLEIKGRNVDVLLFDGFWLRKLPEEKEPSKDLMREIEHHVQQELGYSIKLAEKAMISTIAFEKSKEEIKDEQEQKELKDSYGVKDYLSVKAQFEKEHFKVMHPVCYCTIKDDKVIMRTEEKMRQAYKNHKYIVEEKGRYFKLPFYEDWIKDENILTYDAMDMYPPPLICPPHIFNLWNGFAVERLNVESSGIVLPFINHMSVLVNHEPKALDHFIKWIASIFQQPAILQGTAPIIRGEQGTGKGVGIEVTFEKLLGEDKFYGTCNPTKDVFSRFSNGRMGSFLINIDETKAKESCANSEDMKRAITAPTYNHEVKGIDPIVVKNFNRFIFTTNNPNPVKIEETDRRYFLIDTSSEKIGDKKYFDEYLEYINDETNQKAIHEYLLAIDISSVNWIRDRPQNEAYLDIKKLYVDVVSQFLINVTQLTNEKTVYTFGGVEFHDRFSRWCKNNGHGKKNEVGDFIPPYTQTMFGIKLNLIMNDKTCGIEKSRPQNKVTYKIDTENLKKYFEKRKLLDLDYVFNTKSFLKVCLIEDEGVCNGDEYDP